MKVTCISDTHSLHSINVSDNLTGGDLLIHAGDVSNRGTESDIIDFCEWFNSIDSYQYKVFIAGNHDFLFEVDKDRIKSILKRYDNIIYLLDEEVTINGFKIYGSPWQPRFYNWAFNVDRGSLMPYWDKIPEDTDILITHGPPKGKFDLTQYTGEQVGCEELAARLTQLKNLKLHVFGHIHEGYGVEYNEEGPIFANASICTLRYIPSNLPIDIIL
jgi:Icc-related predicted phosphoesterase